MGSEISLAHQGGVAVATVFLLDYLKRVDWFPWISNHTESLNRMVSLAVAFGTAAGLKVISGDAAHGWVVAIPPLAVIFDTVSHAAAQFGSQEVLHKLLGNHQMNKQILEQLTQLAQNKQ